MARARLSVPLLLLGLGATAIVAVTGGGCPAPAPARVDPICTPGAYVFCRCEGRQEGTKLCLEQGLAFAKCTCAQNGEKPPLSPTGDAGFEKVDPGPIPSGPPIDNKCAGKLAVL